MIPFTSADVIFTENEHIVNQTVVRVWAIAKFQYWLPFILIPFVYMLPFAEQLVIIPIILTILILLLSSYLIRQKWRLTLTDKQIVARQLFPKPFRFLSHTQHFPLSKVEGLTTGPRTFSGILLLGVYLASNIGVTLLKSGWSEGDLPDSLDALLLLMSGMDFIPAIPKLGLLLEDELYWLLNLIKDVQVLLGFLSLGIGLLLVFLTIPRRFTLQIRVRHGADFRLRAGVPRGFWEDCYRHLYHDKIVEAPKQYKRWRFPWFEGENLETNVDLEQTLYMNRFIGLFAIYAGLLRLVTRLQSGLNFFEDNFGLWLIAALTDLFIASLGVKFSKRKNELAVTNKRIIFSQEMPDISGVIGRRLYLMSDIKRDDVAGFAIRKLKRFSFIYLVLTVLATAITVHFFNQMPLFIKILFIILIGVLAAYILQTYVEFNVKTKGGEIWMLKHQLSNPLTGIRKIVGFENPVLTTILSNRLEESEVVDAIQIIRKNDIDLEPKIYGDAKYYRKSEVEIIDENEGSREIELEDLLLNEEEILFKTNVTRGVPKRRLTLSIASFFVISFSSLAFVPLILSAESDSYSHLLWLFFVIPTLMLVSSIIGLWIRYYSLYRATLVITTKRIFFTDIRKPWTILFLLGIFSDRQIEESLQDQIHSTYTSRQFSQQQYWRQLVGYFWNFWLYVSISGIFIAIFISIMNNETGIIDKYPVIETILLPLILAVLYLSAAQVLWSVGNLYVTFIRSLPKRVTHAVGIETHYIVPFSTKSKSDAIVDTVWKGIIGGSKHA